MGVLMRKLGEYEFPIMTILVAFLMLLIVIGLIDYMFNIALIYSFIAAVIITTIWWMLVAKKELR